MRHSLLLLTIASMLWPRLAHAIGCDLSANGCPGDAMVSHDAGNLDCAGGTTTVLAITFMPAESAPDLTGIDVVLDAAVGGDMTAEAVFWDFETLDPEGFFVSHVHPAGGCTAYAQTWNKQGSGEGALATRTTTHTLNIKALAYRPGPLAYSVNQKLFGMQLVIDPPAAGSPTGVGCNAPVSIVLNAVFPRLVSGDVPEPLTYPSVFGTCVTLNGSSALLCAAVPARKTTWGQLKSVYR